MVGGLVVVASLPPRRRHDRSDPRRRLPGPRAPPLPQPWRQPCHPDACARADRPGPHAVEVQRVIALLVMTDGRRHCLERTLASADAELRGHISEVWVHDDSTDPDYRRWLELLLDEWPDITCTII